MCAKDRVKVTLPAQNSQVGKQHSRNAHITAQILLPRPRWHKNIYLIVVYVHVRIWEGPNATDLGMTGRTVIL